MMKDLETLSANLHGKSQREAREYMEALTADELRLILHSWDLAEFSAAATAEAASRYFRDNR
jgi:hypothetical protein